MLTDDKTTIGDGIVIPQQPRAHTTDHQILDDNELTPLIEKNLKRTAIAPGEADYQRAAKDGSVTLNAVKRNEKQMVISKLRG